jgi:hypothetical protein
VRSWVFEVLFGVASDADKAESEQHLDASKISHGVGNAHVGPDRPTSPTKKPHLNVSGNTAWAATSPPRQQWFSILIEEVGEPSKHVKYGNVGMMIRGMLSNIASSGPSFALNQRSPLPFQTIDLRRVEGADRERARMILRSLCGCLRRRFSTNPLLIVSRLGAR